MEQIVLQPFGEVLTPTWLTDMPSIPVDLVLGQYPQELDAACAVIDSLLTRSRRPARLVVVIVSDDLRIVAGGATAPGMAALLKRYGPKNEVGRYVRGCDVACLREDIAKTAEAIIDSRRS